jgi:nicotinamide/nicotinate riboside kinase
VQSNAEGSFWKDPPGYWEEIVHPAYVRAHQDLFEDGDIEKGRPNGRVEGLVLIDGLELDMEGIVNRVCSAIATESRLKIGNASCV